MCTVRCALGGDAEEPVEELDEDPVEEPEDPDEELELEALADPEDPDPPDAIDCADTFAEPPPLEPLELLDDAPPTPPPPEALLLPLECELPSRADDDELDPLKALLCPMLKRDPSARIRDPEAADEEGNDRRADDLRGDSYRMIVRPSGILIRTSILPSSACSA